ncbi:MAG: YicC family protein [Flavobacteriales bacterium]|nr:YicC family protein [Flavobacteriales bacterium]MBK6944038.1 YicC family protein [Flavobacteriales bacterium]MBK9533706.1 YicC family protein [Flavobacteriales bacterium]HQV52569.1 YicC family protein [Flavobacteriales bacterium]
MLRSMTGFGRAEGVVKEKKVTVELRSLNSKQLDLFLKVPSLYKEFEVELRQYLATHISRGKAEAFINVEGLQSAKRTSFDRELVRGYYTELKEIAQDIDPHITTDLFAHVLRMPDVATTTAEEIAEGEWDAVRALFNDAVAALDEFRLSEGARLHTELKERVAEISKLLNEVAEMDAVRAERTRERMRAKLAELEAKVDQDRFEQELIFYLEKLDITEEKVRLRSHCTYFEEAMNGNEQQGRKLSFIAQEMGREINTIGSKANDAAIQQVVVRMKDELEKVKEQILNVL